jgi:hypothetical protein
MRRLFLTILAIVGILIVITVYYVFIPGAPTIQEFLNSSQGNQDNKTSFPFNIPFLFPGTSGSKSGGGAGGSSGGEEGGAAGGGGSKGGTTETPIVKINYTLDVDSVPSYLSIFTDYFINGVEFNTTQTAPYSLQIEEGTNACVILTHITVSGVIRWVLDGNDCPSSECKGWQGCSVPMNSNHKVTVYYTTTQ